MLGASTWLPPWAGWAEGAPLFAGAGTSVPRRLHHRPRGRDSGGPSARLAAHDFSGGCAAGSLIAVGGGCTAVACLGKGWPR